MGSNNNHIPHRDSKHYLPWPPSSWFSLTTTYYRQLKPADEGFWEYQKQEQDKTRELLREKRARLEKEESKKNAL